MKHHGERMKRIEQLLGEVEEQHAEMLRISERLVTLREKVRRELKHLPEPPSPRKGAKRKRP
jgi:predicted component of type VI protein secretion system